MKEPGRDPEEAAPHRVREACRLLGLSVAHRHADGVRAEGVDGLEGGIISDHEDEIVRDFGGYLEDEGARRAVYVVGAAQLDVNLLGLMEGVEHLGDGGEGLGGVGLVARFLRDGHGPHLARNGDQAGDVDSWWGRHVNCLF